MPRHELSYPKTPINKVNRHAERAHYDTTTIHTILSSVPVFHVSFVHDGLPTTLPMIGALGNFSNPSAGLDEVQDLYIHGYVSARLFRGGSSGENGMAVCVSAAIVDGLILSLTPFTHSYNFRSAIVHGTAAPVTDVDEKLYAMEKITDQVLAGRWEGTRVPPTKAELDSTGILRVKITAASAKVKKGGPNETKEDLKDSELVERVWTGVVPTYTVHGEPVPCGGGKAKEVPEYVRATLEKRNEDAKRTAEEAVKK